MLIFDDQNSPIIIDTIYQPMISTHFWGLSLDDFDFTLLPLTMLEEITCSTLELTIGGFSFMLPSHWNILIYDADTHQLDVVELSSAAGKSFTALVGNVADSKYAPSTISITNYLVESRITGPSLSKSMMLCHPISINEFVIVGPTNTYNKYFKGMFVSDLM